MPTPERPLLVLLLVMLGVGIGAALLGSERALTRAPRVPAEGEGGGLVFRLSEAVRGSDPVALVARPPAETLSDDDAARVLSRLPAPLAPPRSEPLALRERSLPPPRPGRTLATVFPPEGPAPTPEPAEAGPLRVLRYQPEGEIEATPRVSITFSRPMVPIASHEALASEAVPLRLAPAVPGEWRWVGTRTLVFEARDRLPMATAFRAALAPDTRAADGSRLESAVEWSFATSAPRLLVHHPGEGPTPHQVLLFAAFDQAIDPAALLAATTLTAAGTSIPLRLATEAERTADPAVARLVAATPPGRWLAFVAERRLPADAAVQVTFGPGAPSAEGPRRTKAPQGWSFRTFGAFRVRRHECGWGGRCTPYQPWRIETTNPIDPKTVTSDQLRVEPELADPRIEVAGTTLLVRGRSKGRTRYRVRPSSEIRDVFGQPLAATGPLEFDVGAAEPSLRGPGREIVVLDPLGPRGVPVHSVNHAALRVRAWSVQPSDWLAWRAYLSAAWRDEKASPPGRLRIDETLRPEGREDEPVLTLVDLRRALADGLGQLALVVQPATASEPARREAIRVWVQSTRIGLDAFADGDRLLAWATDLRDGRPLAGVRLELGAETGATLEATSDAQGLARLRLAETPAPLLVARQGADVAFLPSSDSWWGRGPGWRRAATSDALRFCVFDDRGLYRPGERVRLKGWLRRVTAGPHGDLEPLPPELTALDWRLRDALGNEIAKGAVRPSAFGAFDLAIELPPTMNLGPAALQLEARDSSLAGRQHDHSFQVQEFRRPEFEVSSSASEGPHVVGGVATLTVRAAYYAGGPLPGADVVWRVRSRRASFRPPQREDFVFGTFVPWWEPGVERAAGDDSQSLSARTDGSGLHQLAIALERAEPARPHLLHAEATVMDVNRQAWTASSSLLVHPAFAYLGLRSEKSFVRQGEALALDLIVTDLEGRALAGRKASLRFERLDWRQVAGEWRQLATDVDERELVTTAAPVRIPFEPRAGGSWRVLGRTQDEAGRVNETELRFWVAGGRLPPQRDLMEEKLTLIPDRKQYAAGEVAQVLVLAPFAPAEGILTLRRSGLLREERFTLTEASHTLVIPIEEGMTPNVHVQVDLVGAAARGEPARSPLPPRPAFASGRIELPVPPRSRTLALEARPREAALAPGGRTEVDLVLRDADGRPVAGGEAALVVVDEAVLALTGYRLPDPLATFYAGRPAGVSDQRSRSYVLLAAADDLEAFGASAGAGAEGLDLAPQAAPAPLTRSGLARSKAMLAKPESSESPIATRSDFSALALFAASVPTDAEGRASVSVTLPDNLTRYRVMAVAAAGARQFGSAEATITARLPLMVRPSPPRFLSFGDRFELPVVVQNQTDRELSVAVAVRASNLSLEEGAGRRILVPARDRAEVRFPMRAERAGTARVQVAAVAGEDADAAEVEWPVWTPATTEAFASYGELDESGVVAQPVLPPRGALPGFGGLELTTSSTALSALSDAVLYLVSYPYECAEQLSSRLLAIAALRDVLSAFQAEGLPAPEELRQAAERDLGRLRSLQNDDGGFGFWRRGEPSWPYVSVHAAHALVRAKAGGFSVPDPVLERSRDYLRTIGQRIPDDTPPDVRRLLAAYALSVRAQAGEADPRGARQLLRSAGVDGLSLEALGFLLPLLAGDEGSAAEATAVRRRIGNAVVETAGAAHFTVSYADGAHLVLHSDRRADAILLEALLATEPRSDLVPKLVAGLLAQRKAGRWLNTQENVFVLLALDRYFQAFEKATPDFVARVWLGERYAGEQVFRGRSSDRRQLEIPLAELQRGGRSELLLAKQGPGRLYYRIGLRYAPQALLLEPLDRGFTVERRYEPVDDPADVRRGSDGGWHVRRGARVRVHLTLVAPGRRSHVALVDPLPAGLEPLVPELVTSGSLPAAPSDVRLVGAPGLGGPRRGGRWWWWSRPWFEHQNLRDERAEAFSSLLFEGVYGYSYLARATTPGSFVVAPPRAEEMYSPETFGRGASDRLVVE